MVAPIPAQASQKEKASQKVQTLPQAVVNGEPPQAVVSGEPQQAAVSEEPSQAMVSEEPSQAMVFTLPPQAKVSEDPPDDVSDSCSSDRAESDAETARAGQQLGKPLALPGFGLKGKGLALDLSKLHAVRCEESGADSEASALGSMFEMPRVGGLQSPEMRASLKLNLSAISEPCASTSHQARPVWEFDYPEITLGSRIGAGAFGEVYEASWRRSRIAVKRLLCQRLTDSAREQFYQEMELMSNLRHPNIVRFLGACLEPLQMSILFELCSSSLYQLLHGQARKIGMTYALSLIRQTALGIFYLHQCKLPVLHLDLKSANVLLDFTGMVCNTIHMYVHI